MSFFYDLNKRLATLASKQDAQQIAEEAKATAPKSKLAESIEVAEAGMPTTPKQKKFAKLAPPTDKITFADKIAGAKKEVDEIVDVALDFAESKLLQSINNGSDTATIFYLKTKGKKRGYVEKQEIDHTVSGEVFEIGFGKKDDGAD